MYLPILSLLAGIAVLVWSADRFVTGATSIAHHFKLPPLLIGMVVVGLGTSSPEIAVSALAASSGKTEIALGNAYGSNIANIALILGLTALIRPVEVHSGVLRKELPVLAAVTLLAVYQAMDGQLTRTEACVLLIVFASVIAWSLFQARQNQSDALAIDVERELETRVISVKWAVFWLVCGLVLLTLSSRVLVWGAVELARLLAVSDLVIGLTVVAIGSSLPELASTLAAIRRGEHDLALGNVLGSNLFNTLLVVGIAVAIQPTAIPPELLSRDLVVMGILTLALFGVCYGFRGPAKVKRLEGAALLSVFGGYSFFLISGAAV